MQGHGEKLTRKQERVIASLLIEPTIQKAAESAGVSEVTIWRWMKDENFSNAFREAKKKAIDQALAHLQSVTGQAVQTLQEIMLDTNSPVSSRVAAAKTIVDTAIKVADQWDIEQRIEELERHLNRGVN